MAGIGIRGLSKSFGARDASFAAVADLDLDIADNSLRHAAGALRVRQDHHACG